MTATTAHHARAGALRLPAITPVFVGACMESVALATRRAADGQPIAIAHILIHDASTDANCEVDASTRAALQQRSARVRHHSIEQARGKCLFCLDHDDILNDLQALGGTPPLRRECHAI